MSTQEKDFADKLRHVLNDGLDQLPEHVVERLASARKTAVSRKREASGLSNLAPQAVAAGRSPAHAPGHLGNFFNHPSTYWLSRFSTALMLAIVLSGVLGVMHVQKQRHLQETASMDAAVLSDELPPKAYLDPGFKPYLQHGDTP